MIKSVYITHDCKQLISGSDDKSCIIWNLETGEKIGFFSSTSGINAVSCYPGGIFGGDTSGNIIFLTINKTLMYSGRILVTLRQIWDYEMQKQLPLSSDCLVCGHRFAPPTEVLTTIETITMKADLRPEQSPCLELPDEAWEDSGLLSNCPNCGAELKFNPFIAGGDN
jgi:WD40 repeat protein